MRFPLTLCSVSLALLALTVPAIPAELQILEPADNSLLKGTVQFKIKPVHSKGEEFVTNPEISLQDEYGKELQRLRAARDTKTNICSASLNTTQLKDGIYLVTVHYKTLAGEKIIDTREDLTYGVRNTAIAPGRFVVSLEPNGTAKVDDFCDVTVKVFDKKGKPMPGARVEFKVNRGEVDADAQITDSDGEAYASVESEDAASVTLTVKVENLPAATRTIRFVE